MRHKTGLVPRLRIQTDYDGEKHYKQIYHVLHPDGSLAVTMDTEPDAKRYLKLLMKAEK